MNETTFGAAGDGFDDGLSAKRHLRRDVVGLAVKVAEQLRSIVADVCPDVITITIPQQQYPADFLDELAGNNEQGFLSLYVNKDSSICVPISIAGGLGGAYNSFANELDQLTSGLAAVSRKVRQLAEEERQAREERERVAHLGQDPLA